MKRRRIVSAVLVCCMTIAQAACLAGCGEQPAVADEEVIELIEPTAELSGSETVTRRNLYNAKTFEVLVDPYIRDYTYEEARNFIPIERKTGDTIAVGDLIYRANISDNDSKIEKLTEKLTDLQDSYAEYYYDIKTELNDQYWELKELGKDLEDIQDEEPDDQSGHAYTLWEREEERAEGYYNKKELDIMVNEAALKEREELLYLDYEYYARQVQELHLKNEAGNIFADMGGRVVYLKVCDQGEQIPAGTVVASVADMNRKQIVCDAIDRAARNTIKEIYAFFNGKRYELVYDDEASDLTSSVFLLQDPRGEVPVGTYGNIVLYTGVREQVLTVSKEAIHNVGLEKYVYVLEGDKTAVRTVKIGLSDGVYVEILSGLEEGEKVFLDRSDPQPVKTAVLERGSVSVQYSEKGTLYYPIEFTVKCDVSHGKIVFGSWQPYESVVKGRTLTCEKLTDALYLPFRAGDIIANISVVPSDVEKQELAQLESDLKRAEERLADLVKKNEEDSEKLIESRQEEIERMREQLIELVGDYSVTAVRMERDGLLSAVYDTYYRSVGGSYQKISVLPGDEMSRNNVYARMVDNSMAYLLLPDKESLYGRLGYNTTLTISYNNWENQTVTREVPVVTVNLEKNKQALFLNKEVMEDICAYKSEFQSNSNKQTSLSVKGTVKSMDNVLLLPEEAIRLVNSSFGYVNVLMEDGSICPVSVVIGRKYSNNYCVIEGLTEGMTICWE